MWKYDWKYIAMLHTSDSKLSSVEKEISYIAIKGKKGFNKTFSLNL